MADFFFTLVVSGTIFKLIRLSSVRVIVRQNAEKVTISSFIDVRNFKAMHIITQIHILDTIAK